MRKRDSGGPGAKGGNWGHSAHKPNLIVTFGVAAHTTAPSR